MQGLIDRCRFIASCFDSVYSAIIRSYVCLFIAFSSFRCDYNALSSFQFFQSSLFHFLLALLSISHQILLGANSFSHVSSWELSDLPSLRQLIVSSRVCAEEEGRFAVTNCDTLASIHIEDESFTLFSECTLQNLPMLQELSIGADDTREACFARVEKVVLDSLPSLHTLQIYCNAFPNARKYRLHSTCV
mgnify:CR=1 FL=1